MSSPRRVVGTLFFLGYWAFLVFRPFDGQSRADRALNLGNTIPFKFDFPAPVVADSLAFGLFGFMSFMLMVGVLAYRGSFKPADVDVLFPTPVNPKLVLIFRLVRDQLVTVLFPFLMAMIGGRFNFAALQMFFRRFPDHGGYLSKALPSSWFLMSLAWVCIGYAASLFVNRNDLASDRNRKVINWSLAVVLAAAAGYIILSLRQDFNFATAIAISQSPFLRVVFLPATAATAIVMAPITGSLLQGALGLIGLLALIIGPLWLALTQVGNMYDQAATRGFTAETFREMQRKGDSYAMLAEQARTGKYKFKPGRINRYIGSLRMTSGRALLWKQLVLSTRSIGSTIAFCLIIFGFLAALPLLVPNPRGAAGIMFATQGMTVFMLSFAGTQAGFIELLRRVDLQKPLPLRPQTIVFYEVLAKSYLYVLFPLVNLIIVAFNPDIWPSALLCSFAFPTFGILLTSVVLAISVLFPDFEDPTQRGFRGMVQLIAAAMALLPGVALIGGTYLLQINVAWAILIVLPVNLALTALTNLIAGNLYATYNPSE